MSSKKRPSGVDLIPGRKHRLPTDGVGVIADVVRQRSGALVERLNELFSRRPDLGAAFIEAAHFVKVLQLARELRDDRKRRGFRASISNRGRIRNHVFPLLSTRPISAPPASHGRRSPAPAPSRRRRAGHERFETTQGYIRQAEAVGLASDSPFPALPSFLVWLESSRTAVNDDSDILTTRNC
jgi:hypothetical protein